MTIMSPMLISDADSSLRISVLKSFAIEMEVGTKQGRWTTHDPGLERNDLRALARWLRQLAKGRKPKELGFMEPNVRFECLSNEDAVRIRVWFEGEARPHWAPFDHWSMEDFWLDLEVSRPEIGAAGELLAVELTRAESSE